MGTNGFREDELFTETVNGQTRVFPVVGGRLRLAHEENQNLNLQTEMVNWDGQYAIFKCSAVTSKGQYVGYGTANSQRDAKLAESLVELAETRSVARALRFAGYGLEFTGAEEVSHVGAADSEKEQSRSKAHAAVFPEDNGNGKREKSKPSSDGIGPATTGETGAPLGTFASLLPLPLPSANTGAGSLLPVCSFSESAAATWDISSADVNSRPNPANLRALAMLLVSASSTSESASLASL